MSPLPAPHFDALAKRLPRSGDSSTEAAEASIGDFETSLARVETAVSKLESDEMTLDESLREYEQAVAALRRCQASLDTARQRVMVLSGFDEDGNPVTVPMETAEQTDETLTQKQESRGRRRGAVKTPKKRDPPDNLELDLAPF